MRKGLIIAAIVAAGLCGCKSADEGQGKAELVAEMESIQPGTPFMAGVLITLPKHWHTYWLNPGDSGMAPELKWQLPEGFTAGPILWPAPKRFEEPPSVSFGYDDKVLLLREIRPPADLAVGRDYTFEVNAAWLICKELCIAKTGWLQLTVHARADPPVKSAKGDSVFDSAKRAIPIQDPQWKFRATADKTAVLLYVIAPAGDLSKAEFFPAQPNLVEYGQQAWAESQGEYCLRMNRISGDEPLPARLEGVLVVPHEEGTKALDVSVELESERKTG
jgi:thiol:disulfide interchange protein DsbD